MATLADATTLREADGTGRYAVDLDVQWTANRHCTAGYLCGIVTRAVLEDPRTPSPFPVAVAARYLRVTSPGSAEVQVEPLRAGAGLSHSAVTLSVGGTACVTAMVTTGDVPHATAGGPAPPELPAERDCLRLPSEAPGFDLPVMDVLAQFADPATLTWLGGAPTRQGLAQGWLRPEDGSPPDPLLVLAAFDSLPTATYDRGLEGWAATVDVSVHLLGTPAPGPLRLRRTVHAIAGDLVTLRCDLWDAESAPVATGQQLCTLVG